MMGANDQRMEALALANTVRLGGVQVCKELRCGVISLGDALADGRAAHLTVNRLLCSMLRWGPFKTNHLCYTLLISPNRLVGQLTERQRGMIVKAAGR